MTKSAPDYVVFDWKIVDHVVVSRALPGNISDTLWDQFLKEMMANPTRVNLALSYGSPSLTATQRKAAADALKKQGIFSAVVTDSALVRGIVTAVGWLGANTKSFSWYDIDAAIDCCDVSPGEQEQHLRAVIDEFIARREAAGSAI